MLGRNKLYDYLTANEIKTISEFQLDEKLQFVNQINFSERTGMTDKKQNKFYLLSSNSSIEDGYPVWGSSDFSMMTSDDNTAKSYIVITDSNGVLYVYSE